MTLVNAIAISFPTCIFTFDEAGEMETSTGTYPTIYKALQRIMKFNFTAVNSTDGTVGSKVVQK